ncbi:terpenoid synthase [Periconia macrospinosa]|uniref:geranylgeranyl diphosphate synthase n=1 Tax=Periconia macrospinosa TaxID=97972 RepID=A0A2V1DFE4_9PLEO|nr:terpenoid synthase [Periconia macrospinosa]
MSLATESIITRPVSPPNSLEDTQNNPPGEQDTRGLEKYIVEVGVDAIKKERNNIGSPHSPARSASSNGDIRVAEGHSPTTKGEAGETFNPDSLIEHLGNSRLNDWSNEEEKILLGPYGYLITHSGKGMRTTLIKGINEWLQVPQQSLDIIVEVVEMLHTASLLVDDVEDSSLMRRGVPVAHSIFGVPQTINSANYIYFLALQRLELLQNHAAALKIFTEEMLNLHRGQGMDLYWRDSLKPPTQSNYLKMISNKTGGLFRIAVRLMQAESKTSLDCIPFIDLVGIIFQVRDDYLNLTSSTYTKDKGFCEDITEGKFSFLITHSIWKNTLNMELLNILKQRTVDPVIKTYALKYIEGTGSFEYTKAVLAQALGRAREMADELSRNGREGKIIASTLDKLEL